ADGGTNGYELWKSDGSAAGTVLVKDINPYTGSNPGAMVAVGPKLFFTADDGTHGQEAWVSDGTDSGTTLLADVYPGPVWGNVSKFAASGGKMFFIGIDGAYPALYVSDGTPAG